MRGLPWLFLGFLLWGIPLKSWATCYEQAARQYQVPAIILQAIARVESRENPDAIHWNRNGSYDIGLMQVNSRWRSHVDPQVWRWIRDPCTNVLVGAWVFRQCIQQFPHLWEAIGCYHAGPSSDRVSRRRRYARQVYRQVITLLGK